MTDITRAARLIRGGLDVVNGVNDDAKEGKAVRITVLRDKLATHHRNAKGRRDLYEAIDRAPTTASRQELLNLR